MKYYRNLFSQLKIYVINLMSGTSKFSSYVTMISYFFIVIINEFFTNPASANRLKLLFFLFTHDHIFVKVFFHYFFTVFVLLKNRFNKFISSIFTSKNNHWFGKFFINTNKLASKTTRNVILIFFWIRTFTLFKLHSKLLHSTLFKLHSKSL